MSDNKIKILCIGDVHLKAGRDQLGPWVQAFKRVVEVAKERQVHAVANCGDTRVDCNSSPDANDVEMRYLIRPLAEAGIAYWVIDGNHDRRGSAHGEVTANSWLQHNRDRDIWQRVEYWNDYDLKRRLFDTKRAIQVLTLPYPPRHVFALGKDLKTKAELDQAASEYIQEKLKRAIPEMVDSEPMLILFHGTVDSPRLQTAGEARMPAGHDVNIPINKFSRVFPAQNMAVACGHIHLAQVLSESSPLVFYTGPLVPQDFDSEDLECGVTLVEFSQGEVKREFVPIESIRYKTVVVDLINPCSIEKVDGIVDLAALGSNEPSIAIAALVKCQIQAPDRTIVKVVIKPAPGLAIDKGSVREALEDAGIIEPRIVIELPESPAVKEMEKKIDAEIGANVTANVTAYLAEHPEAGAALAAAGAGDQDVLDAARAIEVEAFNEN